MKSISFIPTPIHTKEFDTYSDDIFHADRHWEDIIDKHRGWQKRARKLQDRRWRKLSSKMIKDPGKIDLLKL
jgi:hypothetical protein